ncbi:MAG: aminotransferase class I/II-fold pyridoxal phosphate-dependent enzyme [Eubacteriales bacterium]|nr:aminotransferase class I/II-fold pyridoxal phosphate-dependent enzyme [Eubacteriales bacterium]
MKKFSELDNAELLKNLNSLKERYEAYKKNGQKLDMSRGRPCKEQLDLSLDMLNFMSEKEYYISENGTDCRNYGVVDGISEVKALFSQLLGYSTKEIIAAGNSSLNLMHDCLVRALLLGVCGSQRPWIKYSKVKFLCPSPGYDRHFAICELLGIEMIPIKLNDDGPDMDEVEALVSNDASIKGMWCVPQYSNPDGITYSDAVVDRLANMRTLANDFRIFWDNSYFVHDLYPDKRERVKDILEACKKAGNPDRAYVFAATSKVTFPGSGVAILAASENNINAVRKQINVQTIGPDKLNQLRHVRFLRNPCFVEELMNKHADIIRPKFESVLEILDEELEGKGIAHWTKPVGGYFISFYTMEGCARRVEKLANEAGLILTTVGATYPYGRDPYDSNIRIAPTIPSIDELKAAMRLLSVCVQIASIEKILGQVV